MGGFECVLSPDGETITMSRAGVTGEAYECTLTLGEARSLATTLDALLEKTKQEGSRWTEHLCIDIS